MNSSFCYVNAQNKSTREIRIAILTTKEDGGGYGANRNVFLAALD